MPLLRTSSSLDVLQESSALGGLASLRGRGRMGTPFFNRAKMLHLDPPHPPEHLYEVGTTPTVELSANHFLSVCIYKGEGSLKAVSWHLEGLP